MSALPAADPLLVADTVAALPERLRGKLDGAVAVASTWVVSAAGVLLPSGVEVALHPQDGVLLRAEHVVCGCLLAPACLHRASVLAAAPVATVPAAGRPEPEPTGGPTSAPWSPREAEIAQLIGTSAARILDFGVPGAGAAVQSELLRGVHLARLEGLHRLAAAATRVVTGTRAGRADDAAYSLPVLTRDLLEVLEVAHAVRSGLDDPAGWRGRARTSYAPVGGLRLSGLCLEPVVTTSGYAGVVVWLVDAGGRVWSVSDVKPGGAERVLASAETVVALGEVGLTHRQLSRGGMVLSGATANPDGRLGAGAKVRAAAAAGSQWDAALPAGRLGVAQAASQRLVLVDLTVCGAAEDAVLAIDEAGAGVRLRAPASAPGGAFRDNLRLLGAAPGLRLFAVGRGAADAAGTLKVLAVGGGDLRLPDAFGGHADLGIDRLSPAFLVPSGPPPAFPTALGSPDPLADLRRRLQRVVAGGRRTLTAPGTAARARAEVAALRRAQLSTAADLLQALASAGQYGERDAFGRLVLDDPTALATAWLAAGIYDREVGTALAQRSAPAGPAGPPSPAAAGQVDALRG